MRSLVNYIQTRQNALKLRDQSKELGKSPDIFKAIESIQKSINDGQKLSNLSLDGFKKYNELLETKTKIEKQLSETQSEKSLIESVLLEVISNRNQLLGVIEVGTDIEIKGNIDRILDQIPELPLEILAIRERIETDYSELIKNVEHEIANLNYDEKMKKISDSLIEVANQLKPFLIKLSGQKELQKLTNNLELENKKHAQAISLEKQFKTVLKDYDKDRKSVV